MSSDDENDYLADLNIEYEDEDINDDIEDEDDDDKDMSSENQSNDATPPISKKAILSKKIQNPPMCAVNSVLGRSNKSFIKIIVPDDERTTSNVLGRGEYSTILAAISTMVANGSIAAPGGSTFGKISVSQSVTIAKMIIENRKVPFLLERPVSPPDEPNIEIERWDANKMIIPKYID